MGCGLSGDGNCLLRSLGLAILPAINRLGSPQHDTPVSTPLFELGSRSSLSVGTHGPAVVGISQECFGMVTQRKARVGKKAKSIS